MLHVMVSLDLANAKKDRPDFNKYLADAKWMKLSRVDTVWSIRFPNAYEKDIQLIADTIEKTLLAAAKELKLERINYVAQIGNEDSIGRYIVYKDGGYKKGKFNPRKPVENPA